MNITARNVNDALNEGLWHLRTSGEQESSRAGPVLVAKTPIMTTYLNPTEKVLFWPERDANPVFHLMESIWMLAGRDDVDFLLPFNSGYVNFADNDGGPGFVHGAYGHRWRKAFGIDQIMVIIAKLKKNPLDRQAVLQMWDEGEMDDLTGEWKDRPCNTHIYFDGRHGRLNMTVCCRSNDIIWGAYGANSVHFSFLQELIAHGVGLPVGIYRQFSNNYHLYTENDVAKRCLAAVAPDSDHYTEGTVSVQPLLEPGEDVGRFLSECESFCNMASTYRNEFLTRVAHPLRAAYIGRKVKQDRWELFLRELPQDNDWYVGFSEWVARRDAVL